MEASKSQSSIRGSNPNTVKTSVQSVAESLVTDKPSATKLRNNNNRILPARNPANSASSSRIDQHQPFFYHTNSTNHSFSLHSPPISSTYHTTLSLILFLHLIYLYQWNRRLSRSDVATNYDQLVNKRQYWRGLLALISHPPVEGGERDVRHNDYSSHNSDLSSEVNQDESNSATRRFRAAWILYSRIQSILRTSCAPLRVFANRILHPLIFGHLSGLPLLAFVSHILWQCRALEEVYNVHGGRLVLVVPEGEQVSKYTSMATHIVSMDSISGHAAVDSPTSGMSYFRVLIALASTSIFLETSLLRMILRRMDRHMDFTGYSTTPRALLSQRAICTMTSLAAAVLSVYDAIFPHSPPPVLPFVKVSLLTSSGFSVMFSIMILCILAHRIHPVTSVVSGLLSGTLWALGVTSFLGTRYWGNVVIGGLIGAVLLSLKSNPSYSIYLGMVVPCLDYVSWDNEGEIHDPSEPAAASRLIDRENNLDRLESNQTSFSESNDIADYSDSQQPTTIVERRPLLSRTTESTLSNDSSVIRGRVPFINSMESDFDDGSSNANNTGLRARGI